MEHAENAPGEQRFVLFCLVLVLVLVVVLVFVVVAVVVVVCVCVFASEEGVGARDIWGSLSRERRHTMGTMLRGHQNGQGAEYHFFWCLGKSRVLSTDVISATVNHI